MALESAGWLMRAASRSSADKGSGSGAGCSGDQVLVLAPERRIGDLEHVEDAHGDVDGQVGEGARHPEEPHLPFGLQRLHGLHRAVGLHLSPARRHVLLQEIQPVGAELAEALLDPRADDAGRRPYVR